MKRKIFSVSLFVFLACSVFGQYRYSGQWAIHAAGAPTLNKGFNTQIGIEKYFNNNMGSLLVYADYTRYKKFIELMDFHISLPTISALYIYSFDQIIRPPFFINIGAGITAGAEIFEKGSVPYGVVQNFGSKFIYGFVFSPQFEYLINKRISCYIKPDIKYHLRTRFDKVLFCSGIGIKLYF